VDVQGFYFCPAKTRKTDHTPLRFGHKYGLPERDIAREFFGILIRNPGVDLRACVRPLDQCRDGCLKNLPNGNGIVRCGRANED
jgi:hypothetical protein